MQNRRRTQAPAGEARARADCELRASRWAPPLRLTSREQQAVHLRGAPAMLLGRSGTGKTVCMAARMRRDRDLDCSARQIFLSRSSLLATFVKETFARGGAVARETEQTVRSQRGGCSRFLTNEAFVEFLERRTAPLPVERTRDVKTSRQRRRFYRCEEVAARASREAEQEESSASEDDLASSDEEERASSSNAPVLSEDESDDGTQHSGSSRHSSDDPSGRMNRQQPTWPASARCDFARFLQLEMWKGLKLKKAPAQRCWLQIHSFIKGGVHAAICGEPLSKAQYVSEKTGGSLSERRCGLDSAEREEAYKVFLAYERELEQRGWFGTRRYGRDTLSI